MVVVHGTEAGTQPRHMPLAEAQCEKELECTPASHKRLKDEPRDFVVAYAFGGTIDDEQVLGMPAEWQCCSSLQKLAVMAYQQWLLGRERPVDRTGLVDLVQKTPCAI